MLRRIFRDRGGRRPCGSTVPKHAGRDGRGEPVEEHERTYRTDGQHRPVSEELLARALAEHRRRALDLLRAQAQDDLAEDAARSWRLLTAPEQRGHYAVMFQVLAAAITPGSRYGPIAAAVVRDWIDAVTAHLVLHGEDQATATVKATVLASGLKGIALDLRVTADQDRCDAAAAMLIQALSGPTDADLIPGE